MDADVRARAELCWSDGRSGTRVRIELDGPVVWTVELTARLALHARREDRRLSVVSASPAFVEVLDLTGLRLADELGGQVVGQPEGGEHLVGVEERVDGRDALG
jgi:hypothetical protein